MKIDKTKIFDEINNYIFDYLTRFSRKNLYLIINYGEIIIENEGFKICKKLKEENKLKDFNTKNLKNIVQKIYDYIIKNKDELLKKYGNGGRYKTKVLNCKTLKQKQKISAQTSAKLNSQKKQNLVIKTIQNLLETNKKITMKTICNNCKVDNKTVIKYYKDLKQDIKEHNKKIETLNNKEIYKLI